MAPQAEPTTMPGITIRIPIATVAPEESQDQLRATLDDRYYELLE